MLEWRDRLSAPSVRKPPQPAGGDLQVHEDRHEEALNLSVLDLLPSWLEAGPSVNDFQHKSLSRRPFAPRPPRHRAFHTTVQSPSIPTPATIEEALAGPHAAEWAAAIHKELHAFERTTTFENVPRSSASNIVKGR